MSYSVLTCKQDLESILHGTTLNQVVSVDNAFNRAARQLLMDVDLQETKRIVTMTTPIYSQVYDYALPVDVKGNRIIDIRPQVNRSPNDMTPQTYGRAFDIGKAGNAQMFQVQWNTGIKTIRVDRPTAPQGVTVNACDSITDNGTWALVSGSNLVLDTLNYAAGNASLKFDSTATVAQISNSAMTAVDLTDYDDEGVFFLYTYMPTGSSVASVVLNWGDGVGNWEKTVTTTFENTTFQNGWNLLAFDWKTATKTGAPVVSAVDSITVTFNVTSAQTDLRLDNIVCRMGDMMEIVYYSKYFFRDAITGAFQENVTDDSNLINLDTESYNLYLNLLAYLVGQQVQGANILNFDYQFFMKEYEKNYLKYRMLYPSETSFPQSIYYKRPNPNVGQYYNRRSNY